MDEILTLQWRKLHDIYQLRLFNDFVLAFSTQGLQSTSAMEARRMLMSSCGTQWMLCKSPAYLDPSKFHHFQKAAQDNTESYGLSCFYIF